jgi:hypothetical protein
VTVGAQSEEAEADATPDLSIAPSACSSSFAAFSSGSSVRTRCSVRGRSASASRSERDLR